MPGNHRFVGLGEVIGRCAANQSATRYITGRWLKTSQVVLRHIDALLASSSWLFPPNSFTVFSKASFPIEVLRRGDMNALLCRDVLRETRNRPPQ
jgi:hypothetical protein